MPKKESARFAHYARYYDLLYCGKDYTSETRFVHDRLRELGADGTNLLELGCGTGRHAMAFVDLSWQVTGIDLSPGMIAKAKRRAAKTTKIIRLRPSFAVGDMVGLRLGRTYDVVVSLFHVLGYQTSNRELAASMLTAATHLRPGGFFFFDFWFGPAVLTERPSVRVKRLSDEAIDVTRISEPSLHVSRNVVSVDIDVRVEDRQTHRVNHIRETHLVRYFFLPELEQFLATQGLQIVAQGKWMSTEPLDCQSWYGWIAAQKV